MNLTGAPQRLTKGTTLISLSSMPRSTQSIPARRGWRRSRSREEALRVNTINGAYNSHEEAIKGSITPGKLTDFVVLSDDLFTVDKERIKDLQIVRTVVGGTTVYQA
jgi:predicted amidohydrolase YtcJ